MVDQTKDEYVNYRTGKILDWNILCQLNDNVMLKVNPELWIEWDFQKNNELGLDVYKVSYGSEKKAWWLGKCGHEWEALIHGRSRGKRCPYCTNKKILQGYNDMWSTNPDLASLLINREDGYRYMQFSNKKLEWKCPNCRKIIERRVRHVNEKGLHCQRCGITSRSNRQQVKLLREKNVKG